MYNYKKTKMDKGITLIALIITIVVLLILAVVAIRAVQDDGIIGHAQNAASEYTIAQEQENLRLAILEWELVNIDGQTALSSFLEEKYGDNIKIKTTQNNGEELIHLAFMNTKEEYIINSNNEIEHIDFTDDIYVYKYQYENGTYKLRVVVGFPTSLKFAEVKCSVIFNGGDPLEGTVTEVYSEITGGDEGGVLPASKLGYSFLGTINYINISEASSKKSWEMWCEIKSDFTDRVYTTKHLIITNGFDDVPDTSTVFEENNV